MTEIMMGLGEYRFSLETATYNALEKVHSWRWTKVERAGRKPAYQFGGADSDTIEMSGKIFPFFKGGQKQIDHMKVEGDKGTPLILVDGLGQIWGKFCLTRVSAKTSKFIKNGLPQKIEFSISLVEYGEDET